MKLYRSIVSILPHQCLKHFNANRNKKKTQEIYHLRQMHKYKRFRILNPTGKSTGRAVPFHTETFKLLSLDNVRVMTCPTHLRMLSYRAQKSLWTFFFYSSLHSN